MNYYDLCCKHRGKMVQITEKDGRKHVGKIADVDQRHVWLEQPNVGYPGFGYGYQGYQSYQAYQGYGQGAGYGGYGAPSQGYGGQYGAGYGGRPGWGGNPYFVPVALAGIGGFALGSAFFW